MLNKLKNTVINNEKISDQLINMYKVNMNDAEALDIVYEVSREKRLGMLETLQWLEANIMETSEEVFRAYVSGKLTVTNSCKTNYTKKVRLHHNGQRRL